MIETKGKTYDFKGLILSGLDVLEEFEIPLTWIKPKDT
ncbi:MAG: hypothetical protein ACJAWO_000322 [Halieaceae bacterium]